MRQTMVARGNGIGAWRLWCAGALVALLLVTSGCARSENAEETDAFSDPAARRLPSLDPGEPLGTPELVEYVNACNIERLNGAAPPAEPLALKQGAALTLSGWIVDETTRNVPEHAFVVFQSAATEGRWSVPITDRVARDDVAKARNAGVQSGFRARLETSTLPPGEYLVLMLFWQDGPARYCDVGRRVAIQ